MSRGSIAKQIKELDEGEVSNFLKCIISNSISVHEAAIFGLKSEKIQWQWHASPASSVSSSTIGFTSLGSFKEWSEEIVDQKDKYILFLIHLMLQYDRVAYAHYLEVKEDVTELELNYRVVQGDKDLDELYSETRPISYHQAKLYALYWLTSSEARRCLCNKMAKDCIRKQATGTSVQLVGLVCGDEYVNRDIMFEIKECHKENTLSRVCISLNLKNISNKDFYISRAALLLDGFGTDIFNIDQCTDGFGVAKFNIDPPVECTIRMVNYQPKDFILKRGEEISNPVILSDVCNFNKVGKYNVEFSGHVQLCTDGKGEECTPFQPIVGSVAIELDECFDF